MAIEVFNRYEHKYIINEETYEKLLPRLSSHMEADAYNKGGRPYPITNLYYDTPDSYLIRASLESPVYKEKLRLRAYGVPKAGDTVYLEIKKKYMGLVNKRRTPLFLTEAYRFAEDGKVPLKSPGLNRQVAGEIAYFLSVYRPVPKICLSYERTAFFEKGNGDLRISFDSDILSRRDDLFLESGLYGTPLLPKGVYLMEIKTASAMPLWLCETLSELKIRRTSFSKYGAEVKKNKGVIFNERAV